MEITGKLISKAEKVTGNSSKGTWQKQEAIIQTLESYPKNVCIGFWGETIDHLSKFKQNDSVKVFINIESREYNGKWYTEVRAWKIEPFTAQSEAKDSKESGSFIEPNADDPF